MNLNKREREMMILEHRPFVRQMAKKYSRGDSLLQEDLEQEGMIGLIRATDTYDPAKGNKFLTYAGWWVLHYVTRYLDKQAKTMPEDYYDTFSKAVHIPDPGMSPERQTINKDVKEKVLNAIIKKGATDKEVDLLLNRIMSDAPDTFKEVGKRHGVTRQRMEQVERKLIGRLKRLRYGKKAK